MAGRIGAGGIAGEGTGEATRRPPAPAAAPPLLSTVRKIELKWHRLRPHHTIMTISVPFLACHQVTQLQQADIKPNIECPDLERLIIEAIDTVTIKEREVQDRAGRWYSLRIRPYKNVENRIDGAVLALFDAGGSRHDGNDGADDDGKR